MGQSAGRELVRSSPGPFHLAPHKGSPCSGSLWCIDLGGPASAAPPPPPTHTHILLSPLITPRGPWPSAQLQGGVIPSEEAAATQKVQALDPGLRAGSGTRAWAGAPSPAVCPRSGGKPVMGKRSQRAVWALCLSVCLSQTFPTIQSPSGAPGVPGDSFCER